ncbi:MAG TPA: undecaprenyl-diphosphate phosphatase [Candidatus Binatia bacterium]|nr:undecaprenyl-diphosphate phosphatase [Candidatus Binatia bacterium]
MSDAGVVAAKAAVLGVVEGLTEFLPVSSTGHLIVAGRLLDFESPEFEIAIQLGAMLALTWVYRTRLLALASDSARRPDARLLVLKILAAFVPAALVGLALHHWIEETLFRPGFVATTLILGGILILAIDSPGRVGGLEDVERMTFGQALAVGAGQTLSLLPGVSRSGATILAGLLAGLTRRAALDFSFLLALPTMYAACLFALWKARHDLAGSAGVAMAVGLLAAYASALVVIRAFLRYVGDHSLHPFGWYRIAAGAAVLAWLFLG